MKKILKSQDGFFVDGVLKIGENVKIYPNVYFVGDCGVGDGSIIYPNTTIENSVLGKNVVIKSSFVENSTIGDGCAVGPFAHIRPNSSLGKNVQIGNFVEVKNSTISDGTKACHLAYIGDSDIGKNCNIGCGAIFVNYNGKTKNRTKVEDNCFIGSNANIIAPVKISKGTYICAGSTLVTSTSEDDFVIARSRETIKPGRAKQYLNKND